MFVGVDVSMPGVMLGMSHDTTTFNQPKFRPDILFPPHSPNKFAECVYEEMPYQHQGSMGA